MLSSSSAGNNKSSFYSTFDFNSGGQSYLAPLAVLGCFLIAPTSVTACWLRLAREVPSWKRRLSTFLPPFVLVSAFVLSKQVRYSLNAEEREHNVHVDWTWFITHGPNHPILQLISWAACFFSAAIGIVIIVVYYTVGLQQFSLTEQCYLNLFISSGFKHLVLISGQIIAGNDANWCKAVGASLHYFSLCSFAWSGVMAWRWTFGQTFGLTPEQTIRLYTRYCLYAWILPFLIVADCLMLEMQDNEHDVYGGKNCFIVDRYEMRRAFLVPVTVVMLFNIFCFLYLAYMLRSAGRKNLCPFWKEMWVNARAFSALGLATWLGCLGDIAHLYWLSMPFILLQSLQEIFLLLSTMISNLNRYVAAVRIRMLVWLGHWQQLFEEAESHTGSTALYPDEEDDEREFSSSSGWIAGT